jgi:hypothetical protein
MYRPSRALVAEAGCSAPCSAAGVGLFSGRGSGCAALRIPSGTTRRLACGAQAHSMSAIQLLVMAM